MEPSPEIERGIGGLAIDTTSLELQLALLIALALGKDWPFARTLMARPGEVMRTLKQVIDRPGGLAGDLRRLRDDARQLRGERNELIHSVAILTMDHNAAGHKVALLNPARDILKFPTTEELSLLSQRTRALAARCMKLAQQLDQAQRAADTQEPPQQGPARLAR
ncbi:hypothetical protein [Phytohabitans suffuscus]|uniref:Uncharacterized protein n=2 Tax=Phytohabitans suffuscus TaxID=624315 RepID=A0A6F8YAT1_9ACTN|nr:hypothetical protein Psuf_004460 [Phytohabitans suffuscus]